MAPLQTITIIAALTLLPAAFSGWRTDDGKGPVFWALLLAPAVLFGGWLVGRLQSGWHADISDALFIVVAVTTLLFALIAARDAAARRLTVLLFPYLFLLCMLALLAGGAGAPALGDVDAWTALHIGAGVIAYAFITIAAIAAVGVLLQERMLKAKSASAWTRRLPAVAEGERAEIRSLLAGEIALAIGILSGMAVQWRTSASLLEFNHKILLTMLAFAAVGVLLILRARFGLRGRAAARYVLLSYLLVTLGYVGVKIVKDILLA
jgi:ABC-type uncharacterized transport system permease subunit